MSRATALVLRPVPASLPAASKAVLMTPNDLLIAARCRRRAVLLYDAGRTDSGYASRMLMRQILESPHQCRFEPQEGSFIQAFFPFPR